DPPGEGASPPRGSVAAPAGPGYDAGRRPGRQSGGAMARIFVPQETRDGERRVAAVPETVKKLVAAGFEVEIQRGAGLAAGHRDEDYEAAGASLVISAPAAMSSAALVAKVAPPTDTEAAALAEG